MYKQVHLPHPRSQVTYWYRKWKRLYRNIWKGRRNPFEIYVFIITDKSKLVGEEAKGVGVMKDKELKLEEIESSHTLGGWRRLRFYSVVRYTIVNRSRRIYYRKGEGLVVKKAHRPVCMRERGAWAWVGWDLSLTKRDLPQPFATASRLARCAGNRHLFSLFSSGDWPPNAVASGKVPRHRPQSELKSTDRRNGGFACDLSLCGRLPTSTTEHGQTILQTEHFANEDGRGGSVDSDYSVSCIRHLSHKSLCHCGICADDRAPWVISAPNLVHRVQAQHFFGHEVRSSAVRAEDAPAWSHAVDHGTFAE